MRPTSHPMLGLMAAVGVALAGTAARADELFVMPFSCKMSGGQPVLTPSADQKGHAVIGQREERTFRACSPSNPQLCHRWSLHRFDLDCDGKRVPWVEVAAAVEAGRGEGVYLSGDGIEIEMPPQWSLPAGAPCARYREGDGRYHAGFARFCKKRLARTERMSVAMPPGFAPMFGIDGIFVADPSSHVAEAKLPQRERSEPQAHSPKVVAKAEPLPPPAKREPKVTEKEPKQAPALTAPEPVPAVPPASSAASKASPPVAEESAKLAPAGEAPVAGPIIPTIINAANAPTDPLPSPASEAVAAADPVAPEVPAASIAADGVETGSIGTLTTSGSTALDGRQIAIVAFAALSLLTIMLVWRRGRASPARNLSRDIAAVSLDKVHGGVPAVMPKSARDVMPTRAAATRSVATVSDTVPASREEALAVLGMGLGPEANEAAIKKVVDGLRMSWHPDQAQDATDRAAREQRLKQINAAWDILAGRGAG